MDMCQGGGDSSHPYLSWELVAELIIKWAQDKWSGVGGGVKKHILIHVHGGLIEMGPKKWPRQAAFILFRQRNNTFLEILFFFLLEYSCFTVLHYFLLYCKVDQLCLYIYPKKQYILRLAGKRNLGVGAAQWAENLNRVGAWSHQVQS